MSADPVDQEKGIVSEDQVPPAPTPPDTPPPAPKTPDEEAEAYACYWPITWKM